MIKRFIRSFKLADTVIFLFAVSMYIWGLSLSMAYALGFNISIGWLLLFTFISAVIFRLVFFNRITAGIFAFITILTIVLVLTGEKNSTGFIAARNRILELMRGLLRYITGFEGVKPVYEYIICILFIIVILILFGSVYNLKYGFYILMLTALFTIGFCIYTKNQLIYFPYAACGIGLFVLFARYSGGSKNLTLIFSAVPAIIICFIIAGFIPSYSGDNVYDLRSALTKPFDKISDMLYPTFSPKYYSFRNSGYVDKYNRLGGNIWLNDRKIMEVDAEEPMHLIGAYKDTYTGYSWINSEEAGNVEAFDKTGVLGGEVSKDKDIPSVELLEMAFSNIIYSMDLGEFEGLARILENAELITSSGYNNRSEYVMNGIFTVEMQLSMYKRKEADIYVMASPTFSLFNTNMASGVLLSDENKDAELYKYDGMLISSELIEMDEQYGLVYRTVPTKKISYWNHILYSTRRGVYQQLKTEFERLHEKYDFDKNQLFVNFDESRDTDPNNLHMLNIYPEGSGYFDSENAIAYEDFLIDTLIPRAEEINRRYTALPEYFPERVRQLAEELTEDIAKDYFKAVAIASFLGDFPYTLSPGEIPKDRDFVDYFLFDSQTGYCTYYASAFVTMCRAVGLPARYVEGYITPDKKENGVYVITNQQAHAWAEVYFEGYGWVTFDPTPSNGRTEVSSELKALKETYQASEEDLRIDFGRTDIVALDEPSTILPALAEDREISDGNINKDIGETGSVNKNIDDITASADNSLILTKNLLAAVLILIFIIAVFMVFRIALKERKDRNLCILSGNKAAKAYYEKLVRLLAQLGVMADESDTYYILAERAVNSIPIEGIGELAELFSSASYGTLELSMRDIKSIRNIVTLIEAYIKERYGVFQYFNMKYIKGLF